MCIGGGVFGAHGGATTRVARTRARHHVVEWRRWARRPAHVIMLRGGHDALGHVGATRVVARRVVALNDIPSTSGRPLWMARSAENQS